jgi:hypothetical protein
MAGLIRWGEKAVLDYLFGSTVPTIPATLYVALSSADPGYAGTITEAAYTSYTRAAVANNKTNWSAYANSGASGTVNNAVAISFPQCTGGDATCTHAAIMTDIAAGTTMAWGSLTPHKIISSGDTPQFAIGELDIVLAPT